MLNIDQRMCWFYFVSILSSQVDYLPFSIPLLQEAASYTIGYPSSLDVFPGQTQGGGQKAKAERVWGISHLLPPCSDLHFGHRLFPSMTKPLPTPVQRPLLKVFTILQFLLLPLGLG